jgi:AhpD family alkylhydroperoxidase
MAEALAQGLVREAHQAMVGLEAAVWLDPQLRELVRVRTAQINGCADGLVEHAREALALGDTPQRLVALAQWRRSPLFSARERAALELAEALALLPGARAVAAARRYAANHFDERELAQLVFACVSANAWDRVALAVASGAT